MTKKNYYSTRTGQHPTDGKLDLPLLRDAMLEVYEAVRRESLFDEALGFDCVDAGHIHGTLGSDVEGAVLLALRKRDMWPFHERVGSYAEADLFDMLEFLHDHVSAPVDGWYHEYNDCGWHYETFDVEAGRETFRTRVNALLADYADGYEMTEGGEIAVLGDAGVRPLLHAQVPPDTPEPVKKRLAEALRKFRRYGASQEDRRDALRDLADVLEFLREPARKALTSKDESDLFELANRFGIRHHNKHQKLQYDERIWHSWAFYYYLATIHAVIRLITREAKKAGPA